jgi:phosphoserine phosphatase RsbU/P
VPLEVSLAVAAALGVGVGVGVGMLVARRRPSSPPEPAAPSEPSPSPPPAAGDLDAHLVAVAEQARRLARGEPLSLREGNPALAALHDVEQRIDAVLEARARIVATERDLDQARRMYRQILPLSSTTQHDQVSLAGSCAPAAEIGGDWWTYRRLTGGRVVLVIGDATGHGVHSAMIGCMAHGAVRALTQIDEEMLAPRRVLDAVHTAIKVPGVERAGMTLFSALLDPRAGHVQYVNHGHVFPLIARRDASHAIVEVTSITGDHDLDETDDSLAMEIRTGTCRLVPGAVLICFTDGLIERSREHGGRPFGARRLQQALLGAVVPPGTGGLISLRDQVLQAAEAYAAGAPLDDDITLVLCAVDADADAGPS